MSLHFVSVHADGGGDCPIRMAELAQMVDHRLPLFGRQLAAGRVEFNPKSVALLRAARMHRPGYVHTELRGDRGAVVAVDNLAVLVDHDGYHHSEALDRGGQGVKFGFAKVRHRRQGWGKAEAFPLTPGHSVSSSCSEVCSCRAVDSL